VEAGSSTSTVSLRVEGGDEKGTQFLGVYLGHPVPGGYKYGDLAHQVGGFSNLREFGPESALARASSSCKRHTHPFVQGQRSTSTNPQLSDSNTDFFWAPRRGLVTKTEWPTDRRS
jgi:hypothetical protein